MKSVCFPTKLFVILLLASAFCITASSLSAAQSFTAEQLLDRWVEAVGGSEKVAQLESIHKKYDARFSDLEGQSQSWSTAQGDLRQEIKLGSVVDATTVVRRGEKGWARDSNGKVQELQGSDFQDAILDAYLESFSAFVSGRMRGTAESIGMSEDGKHHLLRLRPENGREATIFLNAGTFLPDRMEQQFSDRKQTTFYESWKGFDGLLFPQKIRIDTGRKQQFFLDLVEVRIDEQLQAQLFEQPQEGAPDYGFVQGNSARDIPLQLTNNHIYVPVQLNRSSETLWFVFDTGASMTVIDAEAAQKAGVKGEGNLEVGGAGAGTLETQLVQGITVHMGGAEVRNQRAAIVPLKSLFSREGRRIDGILGYDFISRFVIEIDYAAKNIHAYDYKTYDYKGSGEVIPITLEGQVPYVRGAIQIRDSSQQIPLKLLVDTGMRSTISINRPFHEKHNLTGGITSRVAPMGFGVGGATKDQVARIAELRLGSFKLQDVVAAFSMDEKGAGADKDSEGLLGGEILRRFTLIIDYNRNRLIFEKNSEFDKSFMFDRTGIFFAAEGEDFHTFRVVEVMQDSPASQAGIQKDDVILQAAGKAADQWTFDSLRELFRNAEGKLPLVLMRDGKRIEISLQVRRLI